MDYIVDHNKIKDLETMELFLNVAIKINLNNIGNIFKYILNNINNINIKRLYSYREKYTKYIDIVLYFNSENLDNCIQLIYMSGILKLKLDHPFPKSFYNTLMYNKNVSLDILENLKRKNSNIFDKNLIDYLYDNLKLSEIFDINFFYNK